MQAERTVTLYVGNRLDQAREIAPRELAEQFIQAVRDGHFKEPCGGGVEWALRLWLTGKNGLNVSWDAQDDRALMDAVAARVQIASDETRGMLTRAVWGDDG